jgi:hypothetical protein
VWSDIKIGVLNYNSLAFIKLTNWRKYTRIAVLALRGGRWDGMKSTQACKIETKDPIYSGELSGLI